MIQKYYQKESVNALDQANLVSYELTRVLRYHSEKNEHEAGILSVSHSLW